MPINKIQGLPGLPGLNNVSEEERRKFLLDNEEKLRPYANRPQLYNQAADILFNNQQYVKQFGKDAFNAMNDGSQAAYEARNAQLRDKAVTDAFLNKYRDDEDFNSLASELDIQGMYDLLQSDYMGTKERSRRLEEHRKSAESVGKSFDAAIDNPYTDALGAGFMVLGRAKASQSPYEEYVSNSENDKSIREKLFAETQERREGEVQQQADDLYMSMLDADSAGTKSIADFYDDFDSLATKNSPHYAAFKNSKWLKEYTNEDRLKDYAKYQALKSQYGESVAMQYLDRSIQNRVADAQDGKWTGNTMKKVAATVWSDLGSNLSVLANLGQGPERIGILNQGKDPDKPVFDEAGNIIDYGRNDSWITNPAYWNNVYKYNTFSPTEIKAIEERGGISEDVNVREYGYTPDFISWDTAEEAFSQAGHIIAGVVETGLTGSAGKAAGWALKGAMKGVGLSAKAINAASKAGNITNDLFVMATTGLEGAQLEAMGTFDEQMQTAREKIQEQIRHELYEYQQTIDYDSPEARQAIDTYFQQLRQQDRRRVATSSVEGGTQLPMTDEYLMSVARQQYTNQLLSSKQEELEQLHKRDELEAARAATKAYAANFAMDYVKNVPLTVGIQKYKIAKGSLKGAFDNSIGGSILKDAETGGVKRGLFNSSAKNVSKELAKQLGAGFSDEYLDGVNASFASGIGGNEFDNYIRRTYDPESYNAVVDGMLGNLLSGISSGTEGITERQNLYEGFIGMMAPFASVTVNPNMIFNPKDTWKAVVGGVDANGQQLNFAERLSSVLMNPLLSTYSELREKDRAIDFSIDAINTIVRANKDKLQDAAKIVSALGDFSSPIREVRYSMEDGSVSPSLLDSKDQKMHTAFTLIDALNSLEAIEGSSESSLYKDAVDTLEGLANESLSEEALNEEIDKFLADEDNKSILDMGQEKAREVATERLQKNAQYFMDMKDKVQEINSMFNRSSNLRDIDPRVRSMLVYNLVANDDYKKRLEELEKGLSLSKTDADALYTPNLEARYGTAESRKNALSARERMLSEIKEEKEKIGRDVAKAKEKITSLNQEIRRTADGEKRTALHNEIRQQRNLIDALMFQQQSVNERQRMVTEERNSLSSLAGREDIGTVLSETDILNLDARDRAEMLSVENRQNYSKEQQAVIDHTINNLLQADPDALQKIHDAGILATRISDLKTVYSKLFGNNALAATYLDTVESLRNNAAMAESLQRGIEDNFSKIEGAYENRETNPAAFKNAVLSTNSAVINAYMEDHPEQYADVQPYFDLLKFEEDAANIIKASDSPEAIKVAQLLSLHNMQDRVNSREEAISYLEGIVDSEDVNAEERQVWDALLTNMENFGYQRNATVIEQRKERKKREEEAKAKEQADKERAEAEAKRVAEKAAQEAEERGMRTQELYDRGELNWSTIEEFDLEEPSDAVSSSQLSNDGKGGTDNTGNLLNKDGSIYTETVQTISDITDEDFENPIRSVELPTLPPNVSIAIGTKDRPVIIKKSVFKKNAETHIELEPQDSREILQSALYNPNLVGQTQPITRPDYKVAIHTGDKNSVVILDIYDNKKQVEIVGWRRINSKGLEKMKKQAEREGGQFLILSPIDGSAAALSALPNSLYDGKDTTNPDINQAIVQNNHLIETEDGIQARSLSIDEQAAETSDTNGSVGTSEETTDVSAMNGIGEHAVETNATTLSGNAMSEYEPSLLEREGILKHKQGKRPDDSMSLYYKWMDAAGIKLQEIIDTELHKILANNPNAKVKFMTVRPERNATNDADMSRHLLLVLDYDNKVNKDITHIHNDNNGGVVESDGKKYLVIGTAGYPRGNKEKQALYDILYNPSTRFGMDYGLVQKGKGKWFNEHPTERFRVSENISTEIVPYSLIPGYIVKQTETDDSQPFRSISELISDDARNPYNLTMDNLVWGIQEGRGKFLIVGANTDAVMVPKNPDTNLGRAFVLIPASNGKLVPSYLKPLFYNEMNNGSLKDKVNSLLMSVVSPDYATRLDAVVKLSNTLYLDTQGDDFLLRKNSNVVSLIHDGEVFKTFNLDGDFDRQAFMDAVSEMNPRINITRKVLESKDLLQQYDEAGALQTDIAILRTAGSSYRIYGLDNTGNMIKPETPDNRTVKGADTSDFKADRGIQVPYNGQFYKELDGNFYLNNILVTDQDLILELQYNSRINNGNLVPSSSEGVSEYFIMSSDAENPEVVIRNRNTKEIVILDNVESFGYISKITKSKEDAARESSSEESLKDMHKATITDNVPIELDIDYETGELEVPNTREENPVSAAQKEAPSLPEGSSYTQDNAVDRNLGSLQEGNSSDTSQSFETLIKDRNYMLRVIPLVKTKWRNAPSNIAELAKFLESKHIEVSNIGTSNEAVEAWIKTIEDCR